MMMRLRVMKKLEIDPKYVDAWSNKGNALGGLTRYEEAVVLYGVIIKESPDYALAWSNRACYRLLKGEVGQGLTILGHPIRW